MGIMNAKDALSVRTTAHLLEIILTVNVLVSPHLARWWPETPGSAAQGWYSLVIRPQFPLLKKVPSS